MAVAQEVKLFNRFPFDEVEGKVILAEMGRKHGYLLERHYALYHRC